MQNARYWVASSLLAIAMLHTLPAANALDEVRQPVELNLPEQPLVDTLLAIGSTSGRQIIFPGELMAGTTAPDVRGRYQVEQAVRKALAGTDFRIAIEDDVIFIRSSAGGEGIATPETQLVVTGSRIRGAATPSPVYVLETSAAREQGITDMRGLAASIPQNFNGGQNPGVGTGAETAGSTNIDSSTGLNLRGLGAGSTLTLLNGHRLAYNGTGQAIDFSSVPFAAVERVEIMPDGASALYGSDAIGGVANIILKKDFKGLAANATLGGATDGGYVTQNYSLVGGTLWRTGSIVLTGSFDRNTPILAGQRSYTSGSNRQFTLYPELKSYGFVGSLTQKLSPTITAALDAVYSRRDAVRMTPYTLTAPVETSGLIGTTLSSNVSVVPSVTLALGDWEFGLAGTYGWSRTKSVSRRFPPFSSETVTTNEIFAAEFSGEGPLLRLPAGDVRLALGGGYRHDRLHIQYSASQLGGARDNIFGFAEVNVPLASPSQAIAGLYRASLSLEARYEDFPGTGKVGTPRIGAIWSPVEDVDVRLSWGRSFKVPTLYQRIYAGETILTRGDLYLSNSIPAGQTVLTTYGGRSDLEPEKASSLSAGAVFHPRFLPGLDLSVSYFRLTYRNRILNPVTSIDRVLSNPLFADLVNFSPSLAQIDAAIAQSPYGLTDQTRFATPFDPSQVYAIVDARFRNVSRDRVHGVDASLSYRIDGGDLGDVTLHGGLTYMNSRRVLIAGQADLAIAGTIFNPPHLRARGGASWKYGPILANAIVSHIGGVTDNRQTATVEVDGMTTLDLSVKYHLGDSDGGIDMQLSALNMLNAKPQVIGGSSLLTAFDSTNYSAIGRHISFTLSKVF